MIASGPLSADQYDVLDPEHHALKRVSAMDSCEAGDPECKAYDEVDMTPEEILVSYDRIPKNDFLNSIAPEFFNLRWTKAQLDAFEQYDVSLHPKS